jgi:hypothetical protein
MGFHGFNVSLNINNEIERVWKETGVTYFKGLLWSLPGGIKEIHEQPVRIADLTANRCTVMLSHLNLFLMKERTFMPYSGT